MPMLKKETPTNLLWMIYAVRPLLSILRETTQYFRGILLYPICKQLTVIDRHNSSIIRPLSYAKSQRTSKGTSGA